MKATKPLGHRAYGSIPHLPGSRRGPGDHGLNEGQARILTERTRDSQDVVIVQEKLDGSCVSVANINGEIVPLIRAGYRAVDSPWEQHHHFHRWAMQRATQFRFLLEPGDRVCGEWLEQAHGTRYELKGEPFFAFDIFSDKQRWDFGTAWSLTNHSGLQFVHAVHGGGALGIEAALELIGKGRFGAIDPVEGAVWRLERNGSPEFIAKFVRPEKEDGKYLKMDCAPVWNRRAA